MKRLFTLAIVAMIASLTFAQAPAQKKAAAQSRKIERVVSNAKMQSAMEVKKVQQLKAESAQEISGSMLRRAVRPVAGAAMKQISAAKSLNVNVRPINVAAAQPAAVSAPLKAAGDGVVVNKDAHGIITSVTGESKSYVRQGTAYYVSSQQMYIDDQSGVATIIEDADNSKVYIKDPISRYNNGAWVEGTVVDGTIVVAAKQPIEYDATYSATISLRWGNVDAQGNVVAADAHADNFVFVIDGDMLILQGTEAFSNSGAGDAFFMGAFWDDDNTATGFGDAETVLTYDPDYVGPSTELVVLPTGAQVVDWYLNGVKVTSSSETAIKNQSIKTAFVGDEVYVQGLFSDFPTSWVKGTISGSAVTFAKGQYIGKYGTTDIWFMGVEPSSGELIDATASYDAAKNEITIATQILANGKPDAVYYLTWLKDVVLTKDAAQFEEPVITTLTASLPYANTFDTTSEQEEAAIYDANEDGKTFTFASPSGGTKAARYNYSVSNTADDYVVFPGLTLVAGTSYKVSVDARSYNATYPEKFEVVVGTVAKASSLNVPVIAATEVADKEYKTYTSEFVPEADGVYYFAIHGISAPDQYYLYADNFSVKENNLSAPAAIDSLVVVPGANAALSAELKFTTPSKTLAGDAYAAGTACEVIIARDAEPIDTIATTCGQVITYVDSSIEKPGEYTWSVTATIEGLTTDAVTAKAYVGEDLPLDVENLTATDLDGKVGLTWDPVSTVGSRGGVVIPENVTYNAYAVEMIEFWGMQFPSIDWENPYATGLTATSYDVDFDTNEGDQTYSYFAVTAQNAAGETNGSMGSVLTGAAYSLPFVEEVPAGGLTYWWGVDYDDNIYDADGGIGISEEGQFVFQAPCAGWIELYSGKISLAGANKPQLSFAHAGQGKLVVTVYGPTKQLTKEFTPAAAEAQGAVIDLTELAAESWVRFTIRAEYEAAGQTLIGSIAVVNAIEKDLAITIDTPSKVIAGNKLPVKATIKNNGTNEAKQYVVKFCVNEVEFMTIDSVPTLNFFDTHDISFSVETSIFDEAGDMKVSAEVIYAGDLEMDNNIAEATVALVAPSATPVESVAAEATADGVQISWTVASSSVQQLTEDFESYEGNTIYANGESCGPWAAVDNKPGDAYFWNSADILWPKWEVPYAFGIINFEMSALSFVAPSGSQAALFMSNTTAADKYMISAELPGVAQTISFKALPITTQYGAEKFEILASSTDANVASFTVVASFSSLDEEWTEYSAELPEGTMYFAIHYISNDIFGLFVDDLQYTAGGGTPTSFNVYIDEVLVASATAEETSYTYTEELEEGNHKCSVTAVYGESESAPVSVTLEYNTTGISSISSAAEAATVYNLNGIRMNTSNLKSGVYVVNGQKVVK